MKHLFILLTAMSIGIVSQAQTAGKASGSIKDGGNQKVIDAATISLLKAQDSSLVKAALTDKDGNFVFENIKEGTYLVAASSMGHKKVYSNPFVISQAALEMQIGVLQLVPDKVDLKEVVVNAKKPFIERKSDRTVINVDAAISNAGTTALEVLEKSPGVTVDKDGNISLKGKQGVLVMMDGKQTYLNAQDLANLLKTMPSSSIDQIELMTNPSAKYDAAGNSGIINIKTKKNKQKGFNGNISSTYTQGVYASTNNSANVNYRNGKINAFATVSGNVRTRFENIDITRHYYNTDKSLKAIFEQNNFIKSTNENYNAKLGLDFYANKKTTIGFVVTGFTTPQTKSILNTSYLKSNTGNLDSIVQAKNTEDNSWKNGSVNLNFRKQIDSTGRELTADVDYATFRAMNNMNLSNTSYTPSYDFKGREILIGELPKDINIYSAKVDYTHPFKSGLKLETGVKSSYVNTDNTAGYFNLNGNEKTPDYEKTNHFKYKENINAAYINASREFKKWSFQAGLRLENTYYKGHQLGNPERQDSSFERNFTNLFPTVFVGYNANEKNQFNISYGRRIDRPDYEDLNPFFFFLDKYTYEAGNPFLLPMYSNTFEVAHTYNQFLTTTFTYTNTKDFITQAFEQSGYASIIRQTNYGKKKSYNLSVSAQVTITKWWTASIYGEGNYSNYKGILFGEQVNIAGSNALINISNQFKFKKGWSAELSGFYRTQGIEGQVIVNPLGQMSAGVQKNILNNKATIKLNVRDIFKTLPASGKIEFQNTKATFDQNRDSRVVSLSFSYRFGKPIKGQQKRKTGGASEEQNRIKSVN